MRHVRDVVRSFLAHSLNLYLPGFILDADASIFNSEDVLSVINHSLKQHRTDYAAYWIYFYNNKPNEIADKEIKQAVSSFGRSMFQINKNCHFKFSALLHFATVGASMFIRMNEVEKAFFIENSLIEFIQTKDIITLWNSLGGLVSVAQYCASIDESPLNKSGIERETKLIKEKVGTATIAGVDRETIVATQSGSEMDCLYSDISSAEEDDDATCQEIKRKSSLPSTFSSDHSATKSATAAAACRIPTTDTHRCEAEVFEQNLNAVPVVETYPIIPRVSNVPINLSSSANISQLSPYEIPQLIQVNFFVPQSDAYHPQLRPIIRIPQAHAATYHHLRRPLITKPHARVAAYHRQLRPVTNMPSFYSIHNNAPRANLTGEMLQHPRSSDHILRTQPLICSKYLPERGSNHSESINFNPISGIHERGIAAKFSNKPSATVTRGPLNSNLVQESQRKLTNTDDGCPFDNCAKHRELKTR